MAAAEAALRMLLVMARLWGEVGDERKGWPGRAGGQRPGKFTAGRGQRAVAAAALLY